MHVQSNKKANRIAIEALSAVRNDCSAALTFLLFLFIMSMLGRAWHGTFSPLRKAAITSPLVAVQMKPVLYRPYDRKAASGTLPAARAAPSRPVSMSVPEPPPAPPVSRPTTPVRLESPAFRRMPARTVSIAGPVQSPSVPGISSVAHRRLHRTRFIGVQAFSLVGSAMAIRKLNRIFGGIAQPFRIGSDWNSDNALYVDELLHFQGSYRLARELADLYSWAGVDPAYAEWLGAGFSLATMTFLEYIDGRRKDDQASYSDLVANTLGVIFAVLKPRVPLFQYIDFQISYRSPGDPFQIQKLKNYDRITHWLTMDLQKLLKIPLETGLGYGVTDAFKQTVRPRLFWGISIRWHTLLGLHQENVPAPLKILDVYRFGLQIHIL